MKNIDNKRSPKIENILEKFPKTLMSVSVLIIILNFVIFVVIYSLKNRL